MGTSYDPTTYLNQQATTAPFTSRAASAARAASFLPTIRELSRVADRIGDAKCGHFHWFNEASPETNRKPLYSSRSAFSGSIFTALRAGT